MNFCTCGHPPRDHYADTGACEHIIHTLWGAETCVCDRYEWQGND